MDIVKLDVPLFIRLLELAREEIKKDADIHDLAQRAIELSREGPIDMARYDDLVSFMNRQGEDAQDAYSHSDIKRFRQIVDLASQDTISTAPQEQYAGIDAVTQDAGADQWQGTKNPADIRGTTTRIYGDN
jgi:hypothetical protein